MVASVVTALPLARAERGDVRLRLASALVLAPLALALVWLGGPYFALLVILAAAGMGWEWARLTGCGPVPSVGLVMVATTLPSVVAALGMVRAGVVLGLALAALVWAAASRVRGAAPAWAGLGAAWIALPCLACLWLDAASGRSAVLWLFATVWASDSGAFIAGRSLGGPRLAPRLSPNKTWAGALGGVLGTALVAAAFAWWLGATVMLVVPAGIALGIAAQLGDLGESLAKRHFGVKDSSGLIPGHGGLLDRLDGMLAAAALQALLTLAGGASPLAWQA